MQLNVLSLMSYIDTEQEQKELQDILLQFYRVKADNLLRQFQKAIGTQVDVKFKGGKRIVATLTSVDEKAIGLKYTALEAVEGKKKKEKVEHEDVCPLSEINSVTPYIEFK